MGALREALHCSTFPGVTAATADAVICLIKLASLVPWGPQVTASIAYPLVAGVKEALSLPLPDLSITASLLVCWLIWDSESSEAGTQLSLLFCNQYMSVSSQDSERGAWTMTSQGNLIVHATDVWFLCVLLLACLPNNPLRPFPSHVDLLLLHYRIKYSSLRRAGSYHCLLLEK